jgi:hypothetical protein
MLFRQLSYVDAALQIGLDLLLDGVGNFDADTLDPAFVLGRRAAVLGRVDENPVIGLDAALQFVAEFHVLIQEILHGRNKPVIDGTAEGAVGDEALGHVAFVILFADSFFHNPQINAIHDLKSVIGAENLLQERLEKDLEKD